jgi:hypothetical protein
MKRENGNFTKIPFKDDVCFTLRSQNHGKRILKKVIKTGKLNHIFCR